jgi:hypothetical protein
MAEIASHRYSDRKDELAAVEQEAIQRRHDEDMAHVQHDTAQANERAAQLEKETAEAKAEIADANARALEAQAELAKFKAPRALAADDEAQLIEKLKPFAGVPFDGAAQNDPEPIMLLLQIAEAAKTAGWNWQPWAENPIVMQKPGVPALGMINAVGVEIQITESKHGEWEKAVIALRDGLNAIGIVTNAVAIAEGGGVSARAVHINVGKKP